MSEQYKFSNPDGLYFLTMTIVDWIDLFSRANYKEEMINSLRYCQKEKGLQIHAWVLMESHFHAIVSLSKTATTKGGLSGIVRDLKKFTAKKFVSMITDEYGESRKEWLLEKFEDAAKYMQRIKYYKVWQDGSHPMELESHAFTTQKLDYIHNNPVKAQIVSSPEHYMYSSAIDYAGGKGLLDIIFID